jgi:glycine/D-amino acid oxidase-like deaminating enzyme/nitrite reductase/ring-hydroxylating ferredoxin subunit
MNQHSGTTKSIWMEAPALLDAPRLEGETYADVCIVGAGIAGLTTAYLLTLDGKSVVLVDDGPLAGGETERTTAHLSNALDDRYTFLEAKHGVEGARVAAESHTAAIEKIGAIVAAEKIECDYERLDGYLFVPEGVSTDELRVEREAAHRAGLTAVELVESPPLRLHKTSPCLRFPGQGQFHPLKYLRGVAEAFKARGGRLFLNSHVMTMQGGNNALIETSDEARVECKHVVVATNTPVNDRVAIHTKQAPYRTYAVGIQVPPGSVPQALYWNTAQDAEEQKKGYGASYHYVRLQRSASSDRDVLIVGGEDHKTAQADDAEQRWANLERWTRERFPSAGSTVFRWSGQVMEPVDGLAYIGHNPGDEKNVYVATGDSGHGMTHGTIAGMLIRDLILGRENPWARIYDPSRISTSSVSQFAKENLNVAAKYRELLTGGDVANVNDIPLDSGALIRRGLKKLAVYRDESGKAHFFSAICPHLGCVVRWNRAEKSWDCPCHGSRFSKLGEVLNGPALAGLNRAEKEES